MRVLAFNPGSNSLKFQIVDATSDSWGKKLAWGSVDPIGGDATLTANGEAGKLVDQPLSELAGHEASSNQGHAAAAILAHIAKGDFRAAGVDGMAALDLIACRVVHGGARFRTPVIVDAAVLAEIEALDDLAPLHNASSVAILKVCHQHAPAVRPVAVFDSGFHSTLPEVAYRYPLPYDVAERHGIRRFGFHGISHRYLTMRYAEMHGLPLDRVTIITLHLEGGSSVAAIRGGQSIDTSMGMTPLEGLMMSTRSGDLDPAIVGLLMRKEGLSVEEVEHKLNKESGLAGVSGLSPDTRVLARASAQGDEHARLALAMFAYRVRKYVGAYLAALGGAEAIVFGGGIGENTPSIRQQICEGLEALGLTFDTAANDATIDREGRITRADSRIHAYVIPTEESLMLAREALAAV